MRKRYEFRPGLLDSLEGRVVMSGVGNRQAVLAALDRTKAMTSALVRTEASVRTAVVPTSSTVAVSGQIAGRQLRQPRLVFTVYASPTGGTPLFQEVQRVALRQNQFQVDLGQNTPGGFPASIATTQDSLFVAVARATRPRKPLGPRIALAASAFSITPGPAGPQGETGPAGSQGPTGAQGPNGANGLPGDPGPPGAEGPQGDPGPAGPQGDPGPTGPQGAPGPQGNLGPTGPQGVQGIPGPQGPTGIVQVAYASGAMSIPGPVAAFLGPTVEVTVAAGDVVDVVASATMGSSLFLGAGGLELSLSYAAQGSTTPIAAMSYQGLSVGLGEKTIFTLNTVISGLAAGTYTIGISGSTIDPQWVNNGAGATTARVVRT